MAEAGVTHDIVLSNSTRSLGFMVRPGTYQKERANDFAPQIAVGDDPSLREGIWNTWSQDGAPEGIDQLTFTNRNRIYRSDGNVFLSRGERIMLQAAWNASDASKAATAPMFVDFSTDLVAAGVGTKVRRYNTGADTWTDSTTTLAASCVWLHRHGSAMYAAVGTAQDFYRSTDLITWAQPSAGE